jgi:predicted MPP superfamily phosphohydrolase
MPKKRFEHNKRDSVHFIVTTIALQVLLSLLAFVIYETWITAFGPGWLWLGVVLELLSATFLTATLFAYSHRNWFVRWYYCFAAYWFTCTGPLFGSSIIFVLLERTPQFADVLSPMNAGFISFGLGIILILYGVWQSGRAQIVKIDVTLKNLPDYWRGKTIAFVSDLHLGDVRGRGFSKKIAKRITALNPEIVLIGGDIYDGIRCYADELIAPLGTITAPLSIYCTTGNHEYLRKSQEFLPSIEKMRITILDNAVVDIKGIQIVGVDWRKTDHREDFESAMKAIVINRAKPSILIKHVPDNLDIAERAGLSLVLSGHTHNGQFWPLNHVIDYLFKGYGYGYKALGDMMVYTSSGVGTWGPPFRLGTKSEIVAITLKEK